MKNTLFILAVLSLFLSCENRDMDELREHSEVIDLSGEEDGSLTDELGLYAHAFLPHYTKLWLQSDKRTSFGAGETRTSTSILGGCIDWSNPNSPVLEECGDFLINDDLKLMHNGSRYQLEGDPSEEFLEGYFQSELFGKEVTISNSDLGISETFRVPKEIFVDLYDKHIPNTNLARLDRSNAIIPYTYDSENTNGLLITMYYRGERYGMSLEDIENQNGTSNIERAIHFPNENSNGLLKVPEEFFDGIPSSGIATLYVSRKGGVASEANGKTYYLSSDTEQQLFLVIE